MTLAELLVAIAIIAIAAAVAAPFYRSIAMNISLNAASRDLASDLRLAQQLAVTTQMNHRAVFYPSDNSYAIKNAVSDATIKSRAIKPPITIMSIDSVLINSVVFNSTGAVASSGSITLVNPNNRTSTIEIKPSGYVRIQ